MTFNDLKLINPIIKALEKEGHVVPSLIQEQAIPYILEGKDVLGCAQTGTGKTAAFALPIIQHLIQKEKLNTNGNIRALILTPTRELAIQVRDNFRKYGAFTNLKCSVILGGVNQRSQVEVLQKGVDILVATPGRLLDLVEQKRANLGGVELLVLDEADTMLDMGFIYYVKKIISHIPKERQTLMFSATIPNSIAELARDFLKDYVTVKVNPESPTVDKINQSLYYVDKENKSKLLIDILGGEDIKSVLIFTRTKHGANKLAETLEKNGIDSGVIHGNKTQNARVQALNDFKSGRSKILVATDIAARGIDIIELSHVINYEMPDQAETYIHRIGRTGRAGLAGTAISFCNIDEKSTLKDIQRLIKREIDVVETHNYPMQQLTLSPKEPDRNRKNRNFNKLSSEGRNNSQRGDHSKGQNRDREERSFRNKRRDNQNASFRKRNNSQSKSYSKRQGENREERSFNDKRRNNQKPSFGKRNNSQSESYSKRQGENREERSFGDKPRSNKKSSFGKNKSRNAVYLQNLAPTSLDSNKRKKSFGNKSRQGYKSSFGSHSNGNRNHSQGNRWNKQKRGYK